MTPEHSRVRSPLQPPSIELQVVDASTTRPHDIVAPEAVGHIGRCLAKVWLIRKVLPVYRLHVATEAHLVTMRAHPSPSGKHQTTLVGSSPHMVGSPDFVGPNGRVLLQARAAAVVASLLPVDPPVVESDVLEGFNTASSSA